MRYGRQLAALNAADRLANGEVLEESILEVSKSRQTAVHLSNEAWRRLDELLRHYAEPRHGYLSRALPFPAP